MPIFVAKITYFCGKYQKVGIKKTSVDGTSKWATMNAKAFGR